MRIRSIHAVLFAFVLLVMSSASFGQFRFSVSFGPPALPVYEQPICPGEGYIWTPGYWAWSDDDDDYYWVPGTWVLAPEVGYLWTPPYWAWNEGRYAFYDGYWGPHVGFYGGINYGFGYFGDGFEGGRWDNGRFFYNRSVTNVNVTTIHNVYNTTVVNNRTTVNRVSYSGGNGGVSARPTPQQEAAMHERHLPPAATQTQHIQAARRNPELRASTNRGKPPVAATSRPADFHEGVPAREAGAPYNPPANRAAARPRDNNAAPNREPAPARTENGERPPAASHAKDLPPMDRPPTAHTANAKSDQKYQQQQQKLQQKQDQERQKLQQQQDRDHQRLTQRNSDEARKQQTEQKHQQQTQQLQQRHEQQQQKLQQRQAPPSHSEPKPPNGRPQ
jgi:hypothetical protein